MTTPTVNGPVRLAVIVASVRDGRFAPVISDWFVRQVERHGGFTADLIDLKDEPLSLTMPSLGHDVDPLTERTLAALSPRLAAAEAFVVITPEYNHSFPAALKNAIDWHLEEWRAKPVGFVSYGGVSGGLRAVEHLRHVFAELHATAVRDTVCFHTPWQEGAGEEAPHGAMGAGVAAKTMLDQLAWWAGALTEARARTPYPA
ncbi:NAD(P)H-dependent oxidoreductase [Streptomyces sp. NPDC006235]|uniref:NADPH-dependent FMN reductase n=1 Tax=Streptomyces sp. NPDC006235 TaxID=3156736 RepID=UPI0033AC600B